MHRPCRRIRSSDQPQGSALRFRAEPLLVDFVVASVLLQRGESLVDLGNQFTALGKADAVFMAHQLVANGFDFSLACGGDVVEHVGRVVHGGVHTARLQLKVGIVDIGN